MNKIKVGDKFKIIDCDGAASMSSGLNRAFKRKAFLDGKVFTAAAVPCFDYRYVDSKDISGTLSGVLSFLPEHIRIISKPTVIL